MHHDRRMTARKIASRLKLIEQLPHRRKAVLSPLRFHPLSDPLTPPPMNLTEETPIPPLTYWGGSNINFVMQGEFTVPADFATPIALYLPLGEAGDFSHPEALVYIDGEPYATTDRHHQEFLLPEHYCDGRSHRLIIHGWTGILGEMNYAPTGRQILMGECAVVEIDTPTRAFIATARTALEAAKLLDDLEPAKTRLLNALDEAFIRLDTRDPLNSDHFYATVPAALDALLAGIKEAGVPLDAEVIAIGHAHIDVAWLWTLGQTRRKAGRTFYTALRLMEQFPDYHFTQSQPQLYDYIRQDYPALLNQIKERVAEGRWEPIGGMWIEADCNITGPESLARQFLLGRTFFREHFGKGAESPVLWLPDVFGYAWNLPQLIKQAGMEYFFTIKIGWNQVNKMPYDSFWWQGLDGTKVLTHFSTSPESPWQGEPNLFNSATYNANLSAFTALGSWANLKHKESQHVMLMSYGYGDGGGGPTREMNENAQVLQDFPALPRVRQGKVIDFFRQLEAESGDKLPTWNSELYLEIHRGTYTTQSRNKWANRKSEFLLHDAEFLATWAALLDQSYQYPHATFRKAWELICLNQFHDIIPGSSIHDVYVESQQQYADIRQMAEAARDEALEVIKAHVGGDVLLINPTSFEREDYFNSETAIQMPPYSITEVQSSPTKTLSPVQVERHFLENDLIRVELNPAGDITRIYDKVAQREVLPPGTVANQFQAFEDRPLYWDAWDVDIFYEDKLFLAEPATSIDLTEAGAIEIKRRILNSSYTQRLTLTPNSPRLDIETVIDWHERHTLLKVAFPVDVLSPVATYEIQWGSVQRPTHRNTSWDWARFETCAQKWVDLSEGDYGVALLNDCKYGHDIHDNVIRLSLLRAPTSPDPEADQGRHTFRYSLLPHGRVTPAEIARQAYLLNDPIIDRPGNGKPARMLKPFITGAANIIIETIKQAEDGNGVIVRFYECNRQRGWVTLQTGFPLKAAALSNILEEEQALLEMVGDDQVRLYVTPFQIVTVRLIPT